MTYPGGKGGAGVAQTIINQMPWHSRYHEPFAGEANVYLAKRRAMATYLIERDPGQAERLQSYVEGFASVVVSNGCGIQHLQEFPFKKNDLVYADPPYVHSTRTREKIYDYELTDLEHHILLNILMKLPCRVIISGYASSLYDDKLKDWRRIEFRAMTRGGVRTEVLWMNYPEPTELHDYQWLGTDRKERQRIKRKVNRWVGKLQGLPVLERKAIMEAITAADAAENDDARITNSQKRLQPSLMAAE